MQIGCRYVRLVMFFCEDEGVLKNTPFLFP